MLLTLLLALQAPQATLTGTVRNEQTQAPIAGAIVTLADLSRVTSTDDSGRYRFAGVPSGPQHLAVRAIGHNPRMLHALVPATGQLSIDIALRPVPLRLPSVEVVGALALRGLDRNDSVPEVERWTSAAALRHHPLLSEPDAFRALAGGPVALDPESPSGVHVRGAAADQTAFTLDGIPVFNPYHAGGMYGAWNPDALQGLGLASADAPGSPRSLSGTVAGLTREPGDRLSGRGSLSTTQARVTLDGPLGRGAGFLASFRWGYPSLVAPRGEASYLEGGSGDWLVKLKAPLLGGQASVLGISSQDELAAAAATAAPDSGFPLPPQPNRFEWENSSFGAEWTRSLGTHQLRLLAWNAGATTNSQWAGLAGPLLQRSERRDLGVLASIERRSVRASTIAALRLERVRNRYEITGASSPTSASSLTILTASAEHARDLSDRIALRVGTALSTGGYPSSLRAGPYAHLRWQGSKSLSLSAGLSRSHQFAQSLRNPESVVGAIFPVDLYLGATPGGAPVARSDLALLSAELRPGPGVRLAAQAYARRFAGLLLSAPANPEPYSVDAFATGSGSAAGLSFDAALSTARVGLLASYSLEHARYEQNGSRYAPVYAPTHRFEGGIIVFPTSTAAIRLGAAAALGRRATGVFGDFEWEACNLRDRGCEFAGTPRADYTALGGTRLPAYLRVDLGIRKHWHLTLAGRDASVALFGALTNLFGRDNVLTYRTDPVTGGLEPIAMRPFGPLLVGLDWGF